MRLFGIRIFVSELAPARQFYLETLGLELAWDMPDLEAFGAQLENAQIIVERVAPDDEDAALVGRFVGVSLAVDDIAAKYEALKAAGVHFASPPEKQAWGGTLAQMHDPDGNVLTLLG